jgi:menaquinone-dependent protoporphyrinogen oxidase
MVGAALARRGLDVTVGAAAVVEDLDGFEAVVIGGAIYNNRWHPDATDFVERFLPDLRGRSVWFFSSGPLDDSANSGALAPIPHVAELARTVDIRGHMTFGGVHERRSTGRLASLLDYGPSGDWRDPRQVDQWADRIVAQLNEPRTTIVLPEAAPAEDGGLSRIRRLLSSEELDDDAGLDVLL